MQPLQHLWQSFDRTYEGLKRLLGIFASYGYISFDRTYEGLKQVLEPALKAALEAFDRTYEGLKLPSSVLTTDPRYLLTVPMRV